MHRRRILRALARAALLFAAAFVISSAAYGYNENVPYPYEPDHSAGDCYSCHTNGCSDCHMSSTGYHGPHGSYSTTTNKCEACHSVHVAGGSLKLLPADTIIDSCSVCHDGTGGGGVYGTLAARGVAVGARHSIDATNVIPGGDPATGGSATRIFRGASGRLTCTDCHSPHDAQTVAAFYGDRRRSDRNYPLARNEITNSNKLLKQQPTGGSAVVTEYGSDWCLACHAGRVSGGAVHNHPAESSATVGAPYIYRNLPVLNGDGPTSSTVLAQLGGRPSVRGSGNRGYLMPYPRTAQQTGHYPVCMQCHEDSRDAGDLDTAGVATAQPSAVTTLDGAVPTDNPRFQNFPHESANAKLLVETNDDLCLNCHTLAQLP